MSDHIRASCKEDSINSQQGTLKLAIYQALLLRGACEFDDVAGGVQVLWYLHLGPVKRSLCSHLAGRTRKPVVAVSPPHTRLQLTQNQSGESGSVLEPQCTAHRSDLLGIESNCALRAIR